MDRPSKSRFLNPSGQRLLVLAIAGGLISITKGGMIRLRLLNASPSRFYRLQMESHPFYLIAIDGGAIAEPIEIHELLLAPVNGQKS